MKRFLHYENVVPQKLPLCPYLDNVYFSAAVLKISKCMPFAFRANLIKSSTRSYYTSLKYCCKKQPGEPLPSCFRTMHNSV